jgi:DNA repair protein RadC
MKNTFQLRITPMVQDSQIPVGDKIDSPQLIASFHAKHVRPTMNHGQEHMHVILLNTNIQVIGWTLASMGTVNCTIAAPCDLFRPVIVSGAASFVLVHNHPSGVMAPSSADRKMTANVCKLASMMNLRFLDHLIVSDTVPTDYFSFKECGEMS